MKDIIDKLLLVLKTLTSTAKELHNYEGDRGINPTRRNELRNKQKTISETIDILHEVINKLREKDNSKK